MISPSNNDTPLNTDLRKRDSKVLLKVIKQNEISMLIGIKANDKIQTQYSFNHHESDNFSNRFENQDINVSLTQLCRFYFLHFLIENNFGLY